MVTPQANGKPYLKRVTHGIPETGLQDALRLPRPSTYPHQVKCCLLQKNLPDSQKQEPLKHTVTP